MSNYINIKSTLPKNEIPYTLDENWKWYKWGDIIQDYQQGLVRSNSELNDDYSIEYFKMNFINENGDYSFKGLPKTEASQDEILRYKIKEGDFFINVRNSRELVGKTCAIYNVLRDIVFNHMLVRIKHKNYITGTFMSAYFNTKFGKQILETCKKGTTTVIALYQKDLYNLPVPIPNEKLLKKIDKIYNNINKKIQLLHQINDNLAELAKTIYDYWFVQFDFPDENGKPYKTSGGKMVYNEVLKREIPEGWEVKSLGEIETNIITGKTPPTKDENNFNGNILFITIDDIRQNLFIYNSERTLSEKGANTQRAKFLKKGDICVSCIGTVGVIGIVGKIAQTNQQINSISNPQNFNKYFLLNYLDRYFKDNFTAKKGAVLDNMNKAEFESIIIINPIQNIKEIYYGKVKFLYEKIDTNIQQIQHLQSLRDWLLPMLMNGQISVE
ncbi:restriction endonuclease subunit S [Capnocytophaga leadbetteri]|uniref:restriction endonuclease subunit S n=1 Tax=Capnocytophaga leadbetteri TaxID=327575 RepID=UPI0028EF22D9|nr:restriction endonuclease subunit S [Capnocytophaga leadbetteri]